MRRSRSSGTEISSSVTTTMPCSTRKVSAASADSRVSCFGGRVAFQGDRVVVDWQHELAEYLGLAGRQQPSTVGGHERQVSDQAEHVAGTQRIVGKSFMEWAVCLASKGRQAVPLVAAGKRMFSRANTTSMGIAKPVFPIPPVLINPTSRLFASQSADPESP